MLYALFGDIPFETTATPEAFRSARASRIARLATLNSAPQLQWTGDAAETLEVEMLLHVSAAVVIPAAVRLLMLEGALADHLARPLVWGNGELRGLFILEKMRTADVARAGDGALIACRVSASLVAAPFASLSSAGAAVLSALGLTSAPPGASAISSNPNAAPAIPAANRLPGDVPPSQIVRAA